MQIKILDLKSQSEKIKSEIDFAITNCLNSAEFINSKIVNIFSENLSKYLDNTFIIPCANGTDALQIALMSLDLQEDDEIILPAFTYIATAEVIALLKLKAVLVDVNVNDFNISIESIRNAITPKTKCIVPVHLFGQACDMLSIMQIANEHNLYVIEDTAQSIATDVIYSDDNKKKAGTIGNIGTLSFFPTKNLGAFGDAGAIICNDEFLAKKIKMIANHGQSKKYHHELIGVNSRLDSLQAAILNVKLKYLNEYIHKRQSIAKYYDEHLSNIDQLIIPQRTNYSTHTFHQYTLRVLNNKRDKLKSFLQDKGIPSMIYYPMPVHKQEAYKNWSIGAGGVSVSERLCKEVLSIPIHTELTDEEMEYIVGSIKEFF
ncbi:MAG: DegT/DnrJ/EryC1/StrS family aminotransferase [bacterium]|jgi:UDP-2-acetamido-2-deoxy-ribo-hexuluronate aminotransferase